MLQIHIRIYIYIDYLPRRPNHNLTAVSFQASNPLRFLFRYLFSTKTLPWSDLRRSWGGLGRSGGDLGWSWGGFWGVLGRSWGSWGGLGRLLGDLGWSWGGLWGVLGRLGAVLGCPGRLLGGSWGALGRSKIDQKIDPKLDSKTGRIATEKNGPNTTPVDVSELDQG